MADVRIRIGDESETMDEKRPAATQEFAEQLRASGLSVDLEIILPTGRYGLTPVEWTLLFIATNVATDLISAVTNDLYEGAKKLLRSRKKQGSLRRKLGFVIYGPDDKELRRWTTEEEDESEDTSK